MSFRREWLPGLRMVTWLGLAMCLQRPGVAQILKYFPETDSISIVSGCTPPVVVFQVDTEKAYIDSVSISAGFNTNLYVPDTGKYPSMIKSAYFLVTDSAHLNTYRLVFRDISSGNSYWVEADTTFEPRPDTVELFLRVLKSGVTMDSAQYIAIITQVPLDVHDRSASPSTSTLFSVFPNPLRYSTSVTYHLPSYSFVSVIVYDVLGRRIKSLCSGFRQAGDYEVDWDRTSEAGRVVAAGVYLIVLSTPAARKVLKVVVRK